MYNACISNHSTLSAKLLRKPFPTPNLHILGPRVSLALLDIRKCFQKFCLFFIFRYFPQNGLFILVYLPKCYFSHLSF